MSDAAETWYGHICCTWAPWNDSCPGCNPLPTQIDQMDTDQLKERIACHRPIVDAAIAFVEHRETEVKTDMSLPEQVEWDEREQALYAALDDAVGEAQGQ